MISPTQSPLHVKTQQSQEADSLSPDGIRTHKPRIRVGANRVATGINTLLALQQVILETAWEIKGFVYFLCYLMKPSLHCYEIWLYIRNISDVLLCRHGSIADLNKIMASLFLSMPRTLRGV